MNMCIGVHHTTDAFSSWPFSTSTVLPKLSALPYLPLVPFHSTSTNFLICVRPFSTACSLTLHKFTAVLYWNPFLCTLTYMCTHAYLCVSSHLKVWDWSFHSILSQGERSFLAISSLQGDLPKHHSFMVPFIHISWIFLDWPCKASNYSLASKLSLL